MIKKQFSFLVIFILCLSCNNNDANEISLEEVIAEVVQFEYIRDTGNNTSRLEYEISFFNPNNISVNGFYTITLEADGFQSFRTSSNRSSCIQIEANSSCNITFENEDTLELGAPPNSVEIISIEYRLND